MNGDGESAHISGNAGQDYLLYLQFLSNSCVNKQDIYSIH